MHPLKAEVRQYYILKRGKPILMAGTVRPYMYSKYVQASVCLRCFVSTFFIIYMLFVCLSVDFCTTRDLAKSCSLRHPTLTRLHVPTECVPFESGSVLSSAASTDIPFWGWRCHLRELFFPSGSLFKFLRLCRWRWRCCCRCCCRCAP